MWLALMMALSNPADAAEGHKADLKRALKVACEMDLSRPGSLREAFPGSRLIEARVERVRGAARGVGQGPGQRQAGGARAGGGRAVHRLLMADGGELVFRRIFPAGQLRRLTIERSAGIDAVKTRPLISLNANGACEVREVRQLVYGPGGQALSLKTLGADFTTVLSEEPLNPKVPDGRDPGGVTVALIDTGVNYTLPEIRARLARDKNGVPLGRDYWDDDDQPFDIDVARSPFFPLHHGTAVASILLREAPNVRLIPYRFPRPDMSKFAALIEDAAGKGASIVNLAMGSNRRSDWQALEAAAAARPEMLFVVSAGNNGRDIDQVPVYPAALSLGNILTVTSSDDFGRLAQGSNWGREGVDIMTPGEQVPVIDHRGAQGKASGSSFAVPRITALAARLSAKHPDWKAEELKAAILKRARPAGGGFGRRAVASPIKHGWVPDPTDDFVPQ